jgi:hypothetical protein
MNEHVTAKGVIERDAAYTKEEFMRRLGINEDAWKGMKRRGLIIRKDAKRVYVLGSDWLDFLQQCADKPSSRG